MFAGMWMTNDPMTVTPETDLAQAARLMTEKQIRRLPVLGTFEGEPRLVGILTSTDVARAKPGARLVADAMTPDPVTTSIDTPIEAVAAIMRTGKIGALPVLRGRALVGIVTESDVFDAFVAVFYPTSSGARVTFDIHAEEDVLPFVAELAARHNVRITSFVAMPRQGRSMCVVHFVGDAVDAMIEDIWRSHHRVESVVRTAVPAEAAA